MRKAIISNKKAGDGLYARTEPKPTKKKPADQSSNSSGKKSKA